MIIPVEDPDRQKYRKFGFQLDRILIGQEKADKVHWRTLWLRQCRNAVMGGDHAQLERLIAISEAICELGSGSSQMDLGS